MAAPRRGKPYVWVTHLAKLLGGHQCLWSAWFKAHFTYQKFESEGEQLAEWNRDHSRMMRDRVTELEEAGWTVTTEDQNAFKLEGASAIVAGKPDIVATLPQLGRNAARTVIIDGKTGRERDSDIWQIFLYLYAWPFEHTVKGELAGEVHYKRGDKRIPVHLDQLTEQRRDDIVQLVKVIASDTSPRRAPSRDECSRCNIGVGDCPERFKESRSSAAVMTAGF